MLAQFQERYPQAILNSSLLTIYQGKFVVRVSVHLDGEIRATGMAAAETIEIAEDRARLRAIALMDTQETVQVTPPQESNRLTSIPELNINNFEGDRSTSTTSAATENYPEFSPSPSTDYLSLTTETDSDLVVDEDFGIEPVAPVPSFSKVVTPFVPSTSPEEDFPLLDPPTVTGPVDLSDTLIAIEAELRNLRWTAEQERKYIKRIYNKESRDLLSTQQLYEFLKYLQVFAQTSKELERLGWTNQQGKEYLLENYNKQSRQYLSYQELKEFLQHLQTTG